MKKTKRIPWRQAMWQQMWGLALEECERGRCGPWNGPTKSRVKKRLKELGLTWSDLEHAITKIIKGEKRATSKVC